MAYAIVDGLAVTTLPTLVVLPALYVAGLVADAEDATVPANGA